MNVVSQASLCANACCSFFFIIAPVLFLHSCLSLEAETWRKTTSLALSATDKYCFSNFHIYRCNKSVREIKLYVYRPEFPLKISDVCRNVGIDKVSNLVTGLGSFCYYRYAFSCCYTWYYLHSLLFSWI
jgi:hypothetical protein